LGAANSSRLDAPTIEKVPGYHMAEHRNNFFIKIGADLAKEFLHITPTNRIYPTPENKQKYDIEKVELDTILDKVTKFQYINPRAWKMPVQLLLKAR
jgi:hypothetical protein